MFSHVYLGSPYCVSPCGPTSKKAWRNKPGWTHWRQTVWCSHYFPKCVGEKSFYKASGSVYFQVFWFFQFGCHDQCVFQYCGRFHQQSRWSSCCTSQKDNKLQAFTCACFSYVTHKIVQIRQPQTMKQRKTNRKKEKNLSIFILLTVIFPFGPQLMNLLKIDVIPRQSVDYFRNIIKKVKEKHSADQSVRKQHGDSHLNYSSTLKWVHKKVKYIHKRSLYRQTDFWLL